MSNDQKYELNLRRCTGRKCERLTRRLTCRKFVNAGKEVKAERIENCPWESGGHWWKLLEERINE